jgi:hypothetical protein
LHRFSESSREACIASASPRAARRSVIGPISPPAPKPSSPRRCGSRAPLDAWRQSAVGRLGSQPESPLADDAVAERHSLALAVGRVCASPCSSPFPRVCREMTIIGERSGGEKPRSKAPTLSECSSRGESAVEGGEYLLAQEECRSRSVVAFVRQGRTLELFYADSHGRKPPHISQAIASTFSQNLKISGGPV